MGLSGAVPFSGDPQPALVGVVLVINREEHEVKAAIATGLSFLALAATAVADLPKGSEPVNLSPADFTTNIDNPYWPMKVGSRWVYRETAPDGTNQRVVVTVTDKTKKIANGITARVVHDVVTEKGKPVEVTDDWYAQDKAGNIWYLGEFTTEYENGKPTTTSGSFEAGVDGAQPGIIMPGKAATRSELPAGVLQGRG